MDELQIGICREIMGRINLILCGAEKKHIQDAVIWAGLRVSEVALVYALYPNGNTDIRYSVCIEEASPEANNLHKYIARCMDDDNFLSDLEIEVRTEW